MQKRLRLLLVAVALVSSLQAQNQYTLQNIKVTSSQGTSLIKESVTDDITIITKEEIEESRVTTLNEALSRLANITITQNGGIGTSSSIYMRGMGSKRILILVDGIRYNDPTAVGAVAEFSQIMLNNVERIEIIKGAQSGLWGSDASGGVINIVTSNAKRGYHAGLNLQYGAYDTLQTSLKASYVTRRYDILVSGSYFSNDGFSAAGPKHSEVNYAKRYDELGLEKDSYENKTLNAKFGLNLTNNDRIEANIQAINGFVYYDSGAGVTKDSEDPNTYLQNRFCSLALKHKGSLGNITLHYNLSTFKRETASEWGNYDYEGSVGEVKVDDKINYMANSFLKVGHSYQNFEQIDIAPNIDRNYNAISVYATNYNKFQILANSDTIITESVRYDIYNSFESALTGKFGIKQFIRNDFYFSANIGTGYNAPTLGQLFGQWGANPNLKPEKSSTGDVGFGSDMLWIRYFHNQINGLIDYDRTLGYIQTAGESIFKGVEVGYEDYYFNALGVKALYTFLETKDGNKQALARRPQTQVDVRTTYYATNNLDFGVIAQYVGKRYDSAAKQGAQTGKYAIVDFVTNAKVNKYITFYAKINNLTDKYYQTVDGYETMGRSLYIGLNAKY